MCGLACDRELDRGCLLYGLRVHLLVWTAVHAEAASGISRVILPSYGISSHMLIIKHFSRNTNKKLCS